MKLKNTRKSLKNDHKNSCGKNCRHKVVKNIHFICLKARKMVKDPLTQWISNKDYFNIA